MKAKLTKAILPGVMGLMLTISALLALGLVATQPAAYAAPGDAPLFVRTTLTVTALSRSGGTTQTLYAANADGFRFSNNGRVFIVATNDYSTTITTTFVTPGTVDGLEIADLDEAISAGTTKMVGPFPPSQYSQPTGVNRGTVDLNFSEATSVTVGAFRLP